MLPTEVSGQFIFHIVTILRIGHAPFSNCVLPAWMLAVRPSLFLTRLLYFWKYISVFEFFANDKADDLCSLWLCIRDAKAPGADGQEATAAPSKSFSRDDGVSKTLIAPS